MKAIFDVELTYSINHISEMKYTAFFTDQYRVSAIFDYLNSNYNTIYINNESGYKLKTESNNKLRL